MTDGKRVHVKKFLSYNFHSSMCFWKVSIDAGWALLETNISGGHLFVQVPRFGVRCE